MWNICSRFFGRLLPQEILEKKLYSPILWMGFNYRKAARPLLGNGLLFTTKCPGIPGMHSWPRPRKDERLNRSWSHPVILNTGPLDWESSALTTWPNLLSYQLCIQESQKIRHFPLFTESSPFLSTPRPQFLHKISYLYLYANFWRPHTPQPL